MSSHHYNITGTVTVQTTGKPIQNARVEVWESAPKLTFIQSTYTDANGRFTFEFDISTELNINEILRSNPDLFFKVFQKVNNADKLLLSTEDNPWKEVWDGDQEATLTIDENLLAQPQAKTVSNDTQSFIVTGRVLNGYNEGIAGKTVMAYDVDLKGARIYKTAKTIKELEASGGMQLLGLGKKVTEQDGRFSIPFTTKQYKNAERGFADVVVYVVAEATGDIIGRSRISTDDDYKNNQLTLDVFLTASTERGASEYAKLIAVLQPFAEESGVQLFEVYDSDDQVSFLASETQQDKTNTSIAVQAAKLSNDAATQKEKPDLAPELFYAIGRQGINLVWNELYLKKPDDLSSAINQSIRLNYISGQDNKTIETFIQGVLNTAFEFASKSADNADLFTTLGFSIKLPAQQKAFIQTYSLYGNQPQILWDKLSKQEGFTPDVITSLQLTTQLSVLTGQNTALIDKLRNWRNIKDPSDLLELDDNEWKEIIVVNKIPIPDSVPGFSDEEKTKNYISGMQTTLNGTYPTKKIAVMLKNNQLQFADENIRGKMQLFFEQAKDFDIRKSRITKFDETITKVAGDMHDEVLNCLLLMQRIYQVSPTPDVMNVLISKGYTSGRHIASTPQNAFITQVANELGVDTAMATHNRAHFITMRANHTGHMINDVIKNNSKYITGDKARKKVSDTIKAANWTTLFGSPADCECDDCMSVFSPASYLVDIMQYLDNCPSNNGHHDTVLQVLFKRRPDIGNLLLTCENTNTDIPYIDLVNEIMEYYVAHSIDHTIKFTPGDNTGKATAEELKAEPQYLILDAYKAIYQKVYPFNLPYHQPLDVIRTYLNFLKTSRAELMDVFNRNVKIENPKPPFRITTSIPPAALDAEYMQLSLHEYLILTNHVGGFDGNLILPIGGTAGYYEGINFAENGIPLSGNCIAGNPGILAITGLQYVDLLAILETKFINPGQDAYNVLQNLLIKTTGIAATDLYLHLKKNYQNSSVDGFTNTLLKSNGIDEKDFIKWLQHSFTLFQQTITIYECTLIEGKCTSACNIDNMLLHSVQWLYEKNVNSLVFTPTVSNSPDGSKVGFLNAGSDANINEAFLSRLHRFIRLWRKTGWGIHELDTLIKAVGEPDITPSLIHKLSTIKKINAILNLPLIQIACLWGDIDTYGDNSANFPKNTSLYAQLFLKPTGNVTTGGAATVNIFAIGPLNQYLDLSAPGAKIDDHLPEIFAALSISPDDYNAILSDAAFNGNNLSIPNLSMLYRHKLLADALNLSVTDLCVMKSANCFNVNPFSSPDNTFDFVQKVQKFQDAQTKQTSLTVPLLNYILAGSSKPIDNIALSQDTILKSLPGLHSALLKIDNDNPGSDLDIITTDLLSKKMMVLYSKDITDQFILMLQTGIPPVLSVVVPDQSYTITAPEYAYKFTLIYTSAGGQFQPAEKITDSNGSTAEIVSVSDTKLTLKNVTLSGSKQSLEGSIKVGNSNVTATVVSFMILFQLTGFMTDEEYGKIIGSPGLSTGFEAAVDILYQQSLTALNQGSIVVAPQVICIVPADPNTIFSIPPTLSPKYSYSQSGTSWLLRCSGIMSDDEYSQLKNQGNAQFKSAVNYVYNYPSTFLQNNFTGLYDSGGINDALKNLFGLSGNLINNLTGKLQYFYTSFLPFLLIQLKQKQTVSWLSLLINLDVQSVSAITNSTINTLIQAASETGLDGYYSNIPALANDPTKKTDTEINFPRGINPPVPVTSTKFSVQWIGWVSPATDGDYIFTVIPGDTGDLVNLSVNGLKTDMNSAVSLVGGQLYAVELNYTHTSGNSGLQLCWKSVTIPQSIIHAQFLYPDTCVQALLQQILLYHRAVQAITCFNLSAGEVNYFISHGPDFDNINFLPLTGVQWQRLYDYNALKKTIPSNLLLAIFQQATAENAAVPDVLPSKSLITVIANSNQPKWNVDYLSFLAGMLDTSITPPNTVSSYFGYKAKDFKNEIALLQIKKAMDLAIKTKMPVNASGLPAWIVIETDVTTSVEDVLHPIAEQIKNAVKAKYKDKWLTIATQLNNKIRENQKQALISYLLTLQLQSPDGMGTITDADGLFEYLLIDVQMTSLVVTSRLIQATLAVQLFVDRCFLGLESEVKTDPGTQLLSIDADEWEWMKHYSIYAGLKKIPVYPENYLDPSLRDDKSEFFSDFEAEIKKGDITDENVENAFRNYVSKLNEVAHMDICGFYEDTDTNTIYVFACTHSHPSKFFFRTRDKMLHWQPWQQVQLDIKEVNNTHNKDVDKPDGTKPNGSIGVHLIPVVWNKRLFLFWPEFTQKSIARKSSAATFFAIANNTSPDNSSPQQYWQINLAWSEYVNNKWAPKKLSKDYLSPLYFDDAEGQSFNLLLVDPSHFFWTTKQNIQDKSLSINLYLKDFLNMTGLNQLGSFLIRDPQQQIISTYNIELEQIPQFEVTFQSITPSNDINDKNEVYEAVNSPYMILIKIDGYQQLQPPVPWSVSLPNGSTKPIPVDQDISFEGELLNIKFLITIFNTNVGINKGGSADIYPNPSISLSLARKIGEDIDASFPISWPEGNITNYATLNLTYKFLGFSNEASSTSNPIVAISRDLKKYLPYIPSGYRPCYQSFANSGQLSFIPYYYYDNVLNQPFFVSKNPEVFLGYTGNYEVLFSNNEKKVTIDSFQNFLYNFIYTDINSQKIYFATPDGIPNIVTPFSSLAFYTFFHPFTGEFIKRLNMGGVPALLAADTCEFKEDSNYPYISPYKTNPLIDKSNPIRANDSGSTFRNNYGTNPYVQPFTGDSKRNYYSENVDFSEYGTYSSYNWELFFHAPFLVATMLSRNGKYVEAFKWLKYILDLTSREHLDPLLLDNTTSPYWQVLPFKTQVAEDIVKYIEDLAGYDADPANPNNPVANNQIDAWRSDPLNPFLIARLRPIAFMKNVLMSYVKTCIAAGDAHFYNYTREEIMEATQYYVMGLHALGPAPQFIPAHENIKPGFYNDLKGFLNDFGDAMVEFENVFPYSGPLSITDNKVSQSVLGAGESLYFCVPPNDQLLQYWKTIGDRLFKIRHGQNMNGEFIPLPLYEPPIDPELLLEAKAQGLSISNILSELDTPSALYRFSYLLQKAKEFCNEVIALGNSILSINEKRDAEKLARLRQTQEIYMLNLVTDVKSRALLEAQANLDNLQTNRDTAVLRLQHYAVELLGNAVPDTKAAPILPDDVDENTSLDQFNTSINPVISAIDVSLVGTGDSGVKIIPKEKQELDYSDIAKWSQLAGNAGEAVASVLTMFPKTDTVFALYGEGVKITTTNGMAWGAAASAAARAAMGVSNYFTALSVEASRVASYIRREQDWVFQANMTEREIIQLDKQIIAARIRLQMAQHELDNHQQQIQNAQDIEDFYETKFTNQELYEWMLGQVQDVHKQGYQLAYDMARKAEKAYRFELGIQDSNFIQYGYYNDSYLGITAGEQLQLALKQLESAYLENNVREFELTKHISIVQLNPAALIQLRETGACTFDLPEELLDMDYPGHYFRRIKSVSVSIPCVAGPYTTINSTLRLQANSIRINSDAANANDYARNVNNNNSNFIENNIPFTAIATSAAQNDSGMFELNFRDERYLPYEGAGAISSWQLELNGKYLDPDDYSLTDLSQFNYDTISDVIIHLKYTSREDEHATQFKQYVIQNLQKYFSNVPLMRFFSIKHDFPNEWNAFLNSGKLSPALSIDITNKFPYITVGKTITITKVQLITDVNFESIDMNFTSPALPVKSDLVTLSQDGSFGSLLNGCLTYNTAKTTGIWKFQIVNPDQRITSNNNDLLLIFYYQFK